MNPLLAKVKLPGRVFQLPSKGVFYEKEGTCLSEAVSDGEVHVHPMSALAEMKMRSADLLYSGKVLRELCQECVPEIVNAEQLVSQDVDALFCFLRAVTYGPTLKLVTVHPNCPKGGKTHEHAVDLEGIIQKPNNKIIDHWETAYTIPLSNGQTVRARPNTYGEALRIVYIRQEMNKKRAEGEDVSKLEEKAALMDIMAVIDSVESDGEVVDDREMIDEWLRAITKPVLDEIVAGIGKVTKWGFDFNVTLKCPDCDGEWKYPLDLDPVSFFYG